jgi:predicted nucleic acid-binding protein|tara:strand:+ start:233 stop:418 length:186 start_codon:yes stop_codon:yes gene_type:complete
MDKQQYKELVANLMRKESLMKEQIQEAIKTLTMYDRNCKISMNMAMGHCKKLLKQSLDLNE